MYTLDVEELLSLKYQKLKSDDLKEYIYRLRTELSQYYSRYKEIEPLIEYFDSRIQQKLNDLT